MADYSLIAMTTENPVGANSALGLPPTGRSGSSTGLQGGQSLQTRAAANPFSSLRDIAKSGRTDEPDDNLALYAHETSRFPKVSSVLSRLVQLNAVDETEDITAEKSMAVLLRKAPVKMGTLAGVYLPSIQNILGQARSCARRS